MAHRAPDAPPDPLAAALPAAPGGGAGTRSWRALPRGMSGRLLVLTILFVLLAEITIFVPSVANFRLNWLQRHFETGEAISLVLERMEAESSGSSTMRSGILVLTGTDLIAVRRDGVSRVLAQREGVPIRVDREAAVVPTGGWNALGSIADAFDTLLRGGARNIRVHGPLSGMEQNGTLELVTHETPLREAMLAYARNVAIISLLVSLFTAGLVFASLQALMIRPMQRIAASMEAFAEAPAAETVIQPSGRRDEIGQAERRLHEMQTRLAETLRQRERLAALGLAVSKINHDLRNMLSSALLFSDRLSGLPDPTVQRVAPKLMRSVERAIDYTQSVMAYGRAAEAKPKVAVVDLYALVEEVASFLELAAPPVDWSNRVPPGLEAEADPEQLFRVLQNLGRNAVEAMQNISDEYAGVRRLEIAAFEIADAAAQTGAGARDGARDGDGDGRTTRIVVSDTGPGIEPEARARLFSAFAGSAKAGSTGLGLAIASEIVRAHGGTIRLDERSGPGTSFVIDLPRRGRSRLENERPRSGSDRSRLESDRLTGDGDHRRPMAPPSLAGPVPGPHADD